MTFWACALFVVTGLSVGLTFVQQVHAEEGPAEKGVSERGAVGRGVAEQQPKAKPIAGQTSFQVKRGVNVYPFLWTPTRPVNGGFEGAGYRPVEQYFPRHEFQRMREMGFDYIRLPVNAGPLALASAGERSARADYIFDQVDAILALGLKVIVDIHTPDQGGGAPYTAEALIEGPGMFEALTAVVDSLAERVAKRPADRVALELLNEPQVNCRVAGLWEHRLTPLVRVARARAPYHTLVVTGACGGGSYGLLRLDPAAFADYNMLFSFHYYSPHEFIFQGYQVKPGERNPSIRARYRWPATPEGRTQSLGMFYAAIEDLWFSPSTWGPIVRQYRQISAYYDAAYDGGSITQDFAEMRDWADRHGIPRDRLFLGEFGAPRLKATLFPSYEQERLDWIRTVRTAAESSGIAWAYWCYGSYFGIVNNDEPAVPGRGWPVDAALLDALSLSRPVTTQ